LVPAQEAKALRAWIQDTLQLPVAVAVGETPCTQNADGSWTQLPGMPAEAYATGEALYALHISGDVPVKDVAYQRGIDWLLKNQLADGTWFVPALAVPVQPHTFESFPHGWHQFASEAGSSWATLALLFTLPDKRP